MDITQIKKKLIMAGITVKSLNHRLAKLRRSPDAGTDVRVAASDTGVDVYIYDVIGVPFIQAQDLLCQVPSGASDIRVHINSPGGDVIEGFAIYNMLKNHKARVKVSVEGLAASCGALIAMAGDEIQMAPASFIMIHNPWAMISGDADGLRKEADLLDQISDAFAQVHHERTGQKKQTILNMMKAETWLSPDQALEFGFADIVAGEAVSTDPAGRFDLSIFNNLPDAMRMGLGKQPVRAGTQKHNTEENMNKKLRALLERLGLAKDSTEDQAWAFLAEMDLDAIEDPKEREDLVQAKKDGPTPQAPAAVITRQDLETTAQAAARAERERAATIRGDVAAAGMDTAFAQTLVDQGVSINAAREQIMAKMKTTNQPFGAGSIAVGQTDHDKFRAAVVDGLSFRTNARAEKPAPGFESFRSASIEYIARQCLERMGVSTTGLVTRDQVAREVLKRSAQGGGLSSDDFSSIFMDVANKSLQKAYTESPATWKPIATTVSASDFKTIYGVSLSEAPDLELITQNGEYTEGHLSDSQESYKVNSWGKMIYLTRVMIVNDDMRAFTRIPQLLGASARRKESDIVWGLITGNPLMADKTSLFHADHKNLAAGSDKGLVSTDTLSAGRKAMRLQTGMEGVKLDIRPAFIGVPVAQETQTDILLRSTALPNADMSSGVHNPWAGKLSPISEPRLDDHSEKAWYLFADPNQVDIVEVAYLDGKEMPYTEEQTLFERDAVGYKLRHDFGAGTMDFRGVYKNPGE